ncbi:hypothetical protein GCM10007301_32050 [Azorhizobium oxalatiphilum]|uniref:Acyl-CoA dehydrogenase/oxidase N-terminal domain-containing protein n=1 Tax=Azorhizobium oxalatiphilum TaxID=980631 RepID=A0A917C454_9HYPH|nr:acyl-CoA dehydrogenase family protein [Azorhizobium oxalatiphilum]GGF69907.1 hypothetical protein GCM10007301_32050 [Azorhizobium oxalatiphilum]
MMKPISLAPQLQQQETEADRLLGRLRGIVAEIAGHAAELDHDEAAPLEDIALLARMDALAAPLGEPFGGMGLGSKAQTAGHLARALRLIGWASLPLGRLYEGHVNALVLIQHFGSPEQIGRAARAARNGQLFGVWNTEAPSSALRLERIAGGLRLMGGKTFASGAGFVPCPLVTARTEDGSLLMVLPRLSETDLTMRADLSGWRAHGMRASATGSFDFSGIDVREGDIIGAPGDYHMQPYFSAGAWRFLAVQTGGIERLVDEARTHLSAAGRAGDPHQVARMGEAAAAAETARLWVAQAARIATQPSDAAACIAYVGLARGVVERAGLDVLERVHRSVGLASFQRPHPIERISRDLATYLRQPAPDRALAEAGDYVLGANARLGDLWP